MDGDHSSDLPLLSWRSCPSVCTDRSGSCSDTCRSCHSWICVLEDWMKNAECSGWNEWLLISWSYLPTAYALQGKTCFPTITTACVCVCVWVWKSLSCIWLFATPWTVTWQAPLSMGFSRQEYWSGYPFPSPEDLLDLGIKPRTPVFQADFSPSESWLSLHASLHALSMRPRESPLKCFFFFSTLSKSQS